MSIDRLRSELAASFAEGLRPNKSKARKPQTSTHTLTARYHLREAVDAAGTLHGLGRLLTDERNQTNNYLKANIASAIKHVARGLSNHLEYLEEHSE